MSIKSLRSRLDLAAPIVASMGLFLGGCQSRTSQPIASQAPKPLVSMAVLDRYDPAGGATPRLPGAIVPLPSDYELVWQATDDSGNGHWVMRQTTTGAPGGGIRLLTGEAGPGDAEPMQPAYINQEMARLLVSMREVNRRQAEQLVGIVGEMQQLQNQANLSARNTLYLASQLAQKELEIRKLQADIQLSQQRKQPTKK